MPLSVLLDPSLTSPLAEGVLLIVLAVCFISLLTAIASFIFLLADTIERRSASTWYMPGGLSNEDYESAMVDYSDVRYTKEGGFISTRGRKKSSKQLRNVDKWLQSLPEDEGEQLK